MPGLDDRLPLLNAAPDDTAVTVRLSICSGSGVGDTVISMDIERPLILEPGPPLILELGAGVVPLVGLFP